MDIITAPVNILLHGLLFMRLNTTNNNLEVLVPDIPKHHFVGGIRGSRAEINDRFIDRTDLIGKIDNPSPKDDIPGTVLQFLRSQTDVKFFNGNFSKFKSMIALPWPQGFYSLRLDEIDNSFPYDPKSKVGISIELNARRKINTQLGTVTLLRYATAGAAGLQNFHYYNQPCDPHDPTDVNADLRIAMGCFLPDKSFDLQLMEDAVIKPVNRTGNASLGTTKEDEMSLDEDHSPDLLTICPLAARKRLDDPSVSPANCPTIFVG